ncbi:membrane protein [Candidatus Francisella endociliophora]|uniref:Membrane protein n=1 Tax=Candidatus Francisella endociliophora TaxID=653937 RepID=A0A097EPC4_9GAMM|nr:hypothetical protein [Francisella sp. FSC1006]AIT09417.1 membrane protein [Francisella sp. FSC1006]
MCELNFIPVLADDLLRLVISFLLLMCCIILSFIFAQRKPWNIHFWMCFALFLFCLGGYGYVVHHIYLANTFSYDGFISGASFITVCGLLFTKHKYTTFTDKVFSEKAPILFATFFVFAFIYIVTLKSDFGCIRSYYDLFSEILQIVVYPLLLLFAICTFLYRFSICISVFAISMALFIIENIVFITHAWFAKIRHEIFVEEVACASICIVFGCIAIFVLTRAKRIYKESKDNV